MVNAAPTGDAGGPYTMDEGGEVDLAATGEDPGGDTLTFEWDLDGDGIFGEVGAGAALGNEIGATTTFSAANLDGPSTHTVSLRVEDPDGGVSPEVTTTVDVNNVGPSADADGR